MGNKGEYEIPPDSAVLAPVYPLVIDDLMCSEYLVTTEGVKLNAMPSSTSPIDCSCSPLKHDMGVLIVERYHVILSWLGPSLSVCPWHAGQLTTIKPLVPLSITYNAHNAAAQSQA